MGEVGGCLVMLLVFWALLVADVDPCLPGQPGQRQKEEEAGCEGAFVQAGGTDQEVAMTGQKAGLMGSWKAT